MSFSGISFEQSNDTFFALQKGFSGVSVIHELVRVQSVAVSDDIGNINTFAITNASLEDISGTFPSQPLLFLPNVWTASETDFYFGAQEANIRISYDIDGFTLLGNPFSLTVIEAVPTLNLLP